MKSTQVFLPNSLCLGFPLTAPFWSGRKSGGGPFKEKITVKNIPNPKYIKSRIDLAITVSNLASGR